MMTRLAAGHQMQSPCRRGLIFRASQSKICDATLEPRLHKISAIPGDRDRRKRAARFEDGRRMNQLFRLLSTRLGTGRAGMEPASGPAQARANRAWPAPVAGGRAG